MRHTTALMYRCLYVGTVKVTNQIGKHIINRRRIILHPFYAAPYCDISLHDVLLRTSGRVRSTRYWCFMAYLADFASRHPMIWPDSVFRLSTTNIPSYSIAWIINFAFQKAGPISKILHIGLIWSQKTMCSDTDRFDSCLTSNEPASWHLQYYNYRLVLKLETIQTRSIFETCSLDD